MYLDNPFSNETRCLYLGVWECWVCGCNGTQRGGLSLHHIYGRCSSSALNSALVCGYCHAHMGHSRGERFDLLRKTINFLSRIGYRLTLDDHAFLEQIRDELRGFTL